MKYQWDPDKAKINHQKHGVRFTDAISVFMDDLALTIEDDSAFERRFITIGQDNLGRILLVVYTYRGEDVRLISARKATASERQSYEGY
jgi:uncharacterized DUF497 family protein